MPRDTSSLDVWQGPFGDDTKRPRIPLNFAACAAPEIGGLANLPANLTTGKCSAVRVEVQIAQLEGAELVCS